MKKSALALSAIIAVGAIVYSATTLFSNATSAPQLSWQQNVIQAFGSQGFDITAQQVKAMQSNLEVAIQEACQSPGNSKVDFSALEIAQDLGLNPKTDKQLVNRLTQVIEDLATETQNCRPIKQPRVVENWQSYFEKTVNLNNNENFLSVLRNREFSPVKISWEDIGRYENSVWGDRISDVSIWVRKDESDLTSAQMALSVRRDSNFRDKVLVVPASQIKVHLKQGTRTIEKTLPERLKELGLSSATRDRNVIVSNQFAIVPVPQNPMHQAYSRTDSRAARVAFNFSIYPYSSTNYVITDVIEGSADAVVGPGNHQLLYYNLNGQKAPFTASRAQERQDLLQLEKTLKAQGMDVDVQRYYLIQVPLKKNINGIQYANMGVPPYARAYAPNPGNNNYVNEPLDYSLGSGALMTESKMKSAGIPKPTKMQDQEAGLTKVAIGHGQAEGKYFVGSGFNGNRADEPIRVTVVYFVTPVAEVTRTDIENFAKTFASWDTQAIWGGSFVTKTALK